MLGDFSVLRPNPTSGMVDLGGLGARSGGGESEMVRWNAIFGRWGGMRRGNFEIENKCQKV